MSSNALAIETIRVSFKQIGAVSRNHVSMYASLRVLPVTNEAEIICMLAHEGSDRRSYCHDSEQR